MATTVAKGTNSTGDELEKPFRLLDLPPELWVKIGQMAVDDATSSIRTWTLEQGRDNINYAARPWISDSTAEQNKQLAQPPITKACRVLRAELLSYHYEANVALVVFNSHARWVLNRIYAWLSAIGTESRKKIQQAYILFDDDWHHLDSRRGARADIETMRATYFTDGIAADVGPLTPLSETAAEFQQYYEHFLSSRFQCIVARKITFQ